jgi:hypothetical protein
MSLDILWSQLSFPLNQLCFMGSLCCGNFFGLGVFGIAHFSGRRYKIFRTSLNARIGIRRPRPLCPTHH